MAPIHFRRASQAILLVTAIAVFGQTHPIVPKFEVASVKVAHSRAEESAATARGRGASGPKIDPARVELEYTSMAALLSMAYRVEPFRVQGPDWMATSRFDIKAKIPEGGTAAQVPEMLQSLLEERFHLAARHEAKEQTVYELLIGRDGPKLKLSAPDARPTDEPFPNGTGGRTVLSRFTGPNGIQTLSHWNDYLIYEARSMSVQELAVALGRYLDLPVVDRTGLTGTYEVAVEMPPGFRGRGAGRGASGDESQAPSDASTPSGVSIVRSIEKLGLRLNRVKGQVDYIVVEHLDKVPTEN